MQLPEQAALEQAAALAASLPQALAQDAATQPAGVWLIDASALRHFDSSTLALLLQARRLAQAAGRTLQVSGAPAKLSQLARLYGVAELLGLQPGSGATAAPAATTAAAA